MRPLTCKSCAHHRPSGCVMNAVGWAGRTLARCSASEYLPGSDEREDWDAVSDWQTAYVSAEAQNAR